jgi:glycosyltransferase involved in cell wall biosynthesis
MQPPVVALWAVWAYARKRHVRVAGDLHTGVFDDPKWTWSTKHTLRLLSRAGIAIVTNSGLAEVASRLHCPALVLHDVIEQRELDHTEHEDSSLAAVGSDFAMVPFAYAHDEPVQEVLAAARRTPDITWVLTGRAPDGVVRSASPNVVLTGFVSNQDFFRLMSRAGVIVALTRNEYTMQRAAYEALSLGRPLVTTRTKVLADYYGDAAELVEPTADSIADGVRRALADTHASDKMLALRARRLSEQEHGLARLGKWLDFGVLDPDD